MLFKQLSRHSFTSDTGFAEVLVYVELRSMWIGSKYSFIYMRGLDMFHVCLSVTLQTFKVTLIVLTKGLITLMKTQMLHTNGHTKQEMRQMPVQEDHVFLYRNNNLKICVFCAFFMEQDSRYVEHLREDYQRTKRGNWDVNGTEKVL